MAYLQARYKMKACRLYGYVSMIYLKVRLHMRLIGPISYLGACDIRTKVTKCIPEKITLYFCG